MEKTAQQKFEQLHLNANLERLHKTVEQTIKPFSQESRETLVRFEDAFSQLQEKLKT
jgi:hypothetical protein